MPLFGQSWFLCFWNCKKPIRFAFCHSFADAHCVFIFTCQLMHLDYKNLVTSLKSMNWTKLPLLAHIQLWPKCFPPFLRLHAFWMRPRPRPGRGQGSTVQHEGQPAESRKNWTGERFSKRENRPWKTNLAVPSSDFSITPIDAEKTCLQKYVMG